MSLHKVNILVYPAEINSNLNKGHSERGQTSQRRTIVYEATSLSSVHFLPQERLFYARAIYDLTFFFLITVIIIQNLIFGVIIDTFADLRSEKNKEEDMIKNTCFICGRLGGGGLCVRGVACC